MKFRTGLIVGAAVGYGIARWLRKDDPEVVTEPPPDSIGQGPGLRPMGNQRRKLAVRVQTAGLEAIQWARGNIRSRLGQDGDATWN